MGSFILATPGETQLKKKSSRALPVLNSTWEDNIFTEIASTQNIYSEVTGEQEVRTNGQWAISKACL
jgi:hypothetical protein